MCQGSRDFTEPWKQSSVRAEPKAGAAPAVSKADVVSAIFWGV